MARRLGSARTVNADSMERVYRRRYIRVKAYAIVKTVEWFSHLPHTSDLLNSGAGDHRKSHMNGEGFCGHKGLPAEADAERVEAPTHTSRIKLPPRNGLNSANTSQSCVFGGLPLIRVHRLIRQGADRRRRQSCDRS